MSASGELLSIWQGLIALSPRAKTPFRTSAYVVHTVVRKACRPSFEGGPHREGKTPIAQIVTIDVNEILTWTGQTARNSVSWQVKASGGHVFPCHDHMPSGAMNPARRRFSERRTYRGLGRVGIN